MPMILYSFLISVREKNDNNISIILQSSEVCHLFVYHSVSQPLENYIQFKMCKVIILSYILITDLQKYIKLTTKKNPL